MGRRSALLACIALLAVAPAALADSIPPVSESGSGTVVIITQPGAPTTQVGTSTGDVTSTTGATPASGSAVPIATATPQATPGATATPGAATSTTDTNSTTSVTDSAARVTSAGVVVTDVVTSSQSRSATETTARTTNELELGKAQIDLREGRRGARRAIKLVVRRGTSKARARRLGRSQITVGESNVGSASPTAAADEPAVSLEDRVTIDRVTVRSRSRAAGKHVSTRQRLDIRNLVVKARDQHVLMTIHHATLTRDGRLRVRISVGPGVARMVVVLRRGADVLDPRSYRGAVRDAVEVVSAELAPDTAPGEVLDGLQLRLGSGGVQQGRGRSRGRIDGVVIRVGAAADGVDARASLPGFVEAVIGRAESASRAIRGRLVRTSRSAVIVAGGVADIASGVGDVASATRTFFIRPPKLRFQAPRVVLRRPRAADYVEVHRRGVRSPGPGPERVTDS